MEQANASSIPQQSTRVNKFRVVHDFLDRYPQVCRQALAIGLKHGEDHDSCYIPIWVEDREATMVMDANDDTKCYGVIQWNPKLESYGHMYVNWAHCLHPQAFVLLAIEVRKAARAMGARGISFSVYDTNERMKRLASKLGAKPKTISYAIKGV